MLTTHLTFAQAAVEIGLSATSIHHYHRTGRLKAFKIGNAWVLERNEWREFMLRHAAREFKKGRYVNAKQQNA